MKAKKVYEVRRSSNAMSGMGIGKASILGAYVKIQENPKYARLLDADTTMGLTDFIVKASDNFTDSMMENLKYAINGIEFITSTSDSDFIVITEYDEDFPEWLYSFASEEMWTLVDEDKYSGDVLISSIVVEYDERNSFGRIYHHTRKNYGHFNAYLVRIS